MEEDEFEELPSYVKDDRIKLPDELLENPLKYISNYYESIYPNIGKKVFYLLSLVPVSLITPKIPRGKKDIKQKISILLISNSGTGKTSLAEEFEKITYNPLFVEHLTEARMNYEMRGKKRVSLIVSDIATMFSNDTIVKMVEGALGEEGVIGRNTMKNRDEDMRERIDAVSYLSGTPENITKEIIGWGLLGRTSPLLINHSEQEHDAILDFVNDEMGVETEHTLNYIPHFYNELLKIQEGNHRIPKINGYIIPKDIKDEIKSFIKPLVRPAFVRWGVNAVRETEEVYRFLVSHAFLNIFRKYENGLIHGDKIVIDSKDLKVAKYLIKREVATKEFIIDCINQINYNNLKTIQKLKEWTRRHKISDNAPKIRLMEGMLKR